MRGIYECDHEISISLELEIESFALENCLCE